MLASCPASILNHFSTFLGIPFRIGINPSRSRLERNEMRWNRVRFRVISFEPGVIQPSR